MNKYTYALGGAVIAIGAVALSDGFAQAPARPDLNGIWGGGVAQLTPTTCQKSVNAFDNAGVERFNLGGIAKGGYKWVTFEQDCAIQNRGRVNKPMYKPEFWNRVRLNDLNANVGGDLIEYADPEWQNFPRGVPRMGAPNKIVQTADEVIFLYENRNTFRSIPTDCRDHDPVLKYDQSTMGNAVGCYRGDALVVVSMGFTDRTWLHWSGYMHSAEMVVTETFRRQGDTLIYDVTVEDPVYFMEPWKMDTVRLNVNKTPGIQLMQDVPYDDRSLGALADPHYRG
jgi:hypothetical protein